MPADPLVDAARAAAQDFAMTDEMTELPAALHDLRAACDRYRQALERINRLQPSQADRTAQKIAREALRG